MNVDEALMRVQQRLVAAKSQKNDFGNYQYRSAEQILEAVKPLLNEVGAVLLMSDEIVNVGNRNYVKATVHFVITGESLKSITVNAFACEAENKKGMDPAQITGAASSYARKYALSGLFCIDNNKDPDTNEYKQAEQKGQDDYEKAFKDALVKHADTITVIKEGLAEGSEDGIYRAAEAWFELDNEEKKSIWRAPTKGGPFSKEEYKTIKTSEFRKAYYGDEK